MKHLDDPYMPPPRQGYQTPAPMMTGAAFGGKPEPPQYAQFEVGKSGLAVDPKVPGLSEDALPPMPSWETATKKHVLTEEEKNAVELGELDPATGQKVPLMTGAAAAGTSMPPSPVNGHSPYGAPGQAVGAAYSDIPGDHYAQNQEAFNGNGRAYGGAAPPMDSYAQNGREYGGVVAPVDPYGQNAAGGRGYGGPSAGAGRGGPGRGGPGRGYGSPQNFDGQGSGYGAPAQDPYAADAGFAGPAVDTGVLSQIASTQITRITPKDPFLHNLKDNTLPTLPVLSTVDAAIRIDLIQATITNNRDAWHPHR
jgi:hypothetical protein